MKRKIIIICLVILPILITIIFSICGDPSKLRWYELDTYRYNIFENNIENFDCIIDIVRSDAQKSNNNTGLYVIKELDIYNQKEQEAIKKVFDEYNWHFQEKPKCWEYNENFIYYQDGRAACRLVYSNNGKEPHFDGNEYGDWKWKRVNEHWYFCEFMFKD